MSKFVVHLALKLSNFSVFYYTGRVKRKLIYEDRQSKFIKINPECKNELNRISSIFRERKFYLNVNGDNFIFHDVSGDGDCFYHSVLQPKTSITIIWQCN